MTPFLVHHLPLHAAARLPASEALRYRQEALDYASLADAITAAARGYLALGLGRSERVAIYLEKRLETVTAMFAASCAGGVFVPINPQLKPEQVTYIMADCNVRILVTSADRLNGLAPALEACRDLHTVLVVGGFAPAEASIAGIQCVQWDEAVAWGGGKSPHRVIDTDIAAILYTSGSTGKPKGVVLSHRNMVAGATSVASYLENIPEDRILSLLPLSFDAGFSQLTTGFHVGACVVLQNYFLPRDAVTAVRKERITGITAVPPLWIQIAGLDWGGATEHLRYIANTGGKMPRATLDTLRSALPKTKPFLMYGLTEAFRSTYLPPSEVDRRPDSIGKAIPNAEILVVREDGALCGPNEPGELVHRGALVGLGYWNDPEKTAERYKPAPGQDKGLVMPEIAVWSGDTVRMDEEGFLYFISRRDEMIKTSGYRVSPTEVEEVIYATGLAAEAAAFGVPHPVLGQAIVVVATGPSGQELDTGALLAECKRRLPAWMVPALVQPHQGGLPRNPNGKIDRKALSQGYQDCFEPQS